MTEKDQPGALLVKVNVSRRATIIYFYRTCNLEPAVLLLDGHSGGADRKFRGSFAILDHFLHARLSKSRRNQAYIDEYDSLRSRNASFSRILLIIFDSECLVRGGQDRSGENV